MPEFLVCLQSSARQHLRFAGLRCGMGFTGPGLEDIGQYGELLVALLGPLEALFHSALDPEAYHQCPGPTPLATGARLMVHT